METVSLSDPRHASRAGATAVHLVAMPWPPIYAPYLALTALAAEAKRQGPRRCITEGHLYLRWYARLLAAFGDKASSVYAAVAEDGAYAQVGDMVFARRPEAGADDVIDRYVAAAEIPSISRPLLDELRALASDFVRVEAQRLAAELPSGCLLGLSSTFTQNLPSLALAEALRADRPDVRIALGGSNMSAVRAEVILRNYPQVDYVVYGEGEDTLVSLLRALDNGAEAPLDARGLGYRRRDGAIVTGRARPFVDMTRLAPPEASGYFDELYELGLDADIEPKLAYEIGRGCWWGEKRHCTFCGLNGEGMTFRRRSTDTVAGELLDLISRHEVLDVIFADNILHPDDIEHVFRRLPSSLDLRMHLEVKADLARDQLITLARHGVWHVQPGIESLARRPLQLMRKGVTPMQNVRFLRNAEELGMTASWNILVGFPHESYDDYAEMIARLPLVHHLQPPSSVGPLALVRYSPLFEEAPTFGLNDLRVRRDTSLIYGGLDPADIEVLAEVFESDTKTSGHVRGLVDELTALAETWRKAYPSTFLYEVVADDALVEVRRRTGDTDEPILQIEAAGERRLWDGLRQGVSRHGLGELAREADLSAREIERQLRRFRSLGLIYDDEGCVISLPTRYETHAAFRLT